uniref:Uncharacterized protein n=1 Tax=Arundo donax TaxID=35708 RepID=A0A0A9HR01_ARUDO
MELFHQNFKVRMTCKPFKLGAVSDKINSYFCSILPLFRA